MGEGYQAQIHDLITTMVALGTVDYATTTVAVDVETTSPLLRGTTVADFKGHWSAETTGQPGRKPVVKLVTSVDPQQAWAEFSAVLSFWRRRHPCFRMGTTPR